MGTGLMDQHRVPGRSRGQFGLFVALSVLAVLLAAVSWIAFQFTLMVYTKCGGTGSCTPGVQQGISIGFIVAMVLCLLLPVLSGVARRRKNQSFWWLPLISMVGIILTLAGSWLLNLWAAS
jgi:hypothetical protein